MLTPILLCCLSIQLLLAFHSVHSSDISRQLSDISKKGEGTIYLNGTVNSGINRHIIPDDGEWIIQSYFKNVPSVGFGILVIKGKSIRFEGRFNGIEEDYSWVSFRRASHLMQYAIISFWRPGRYVVPTFVPPENGLNYRNRCPSAEIKYEDRSTVVTYRLKTTFKDSDLGCEFNYKGLWHANFWFTTDERYECSNTRFTFNNESMVSGSSGYIFTDLYYPRVTLFVGRGCYVNVTLTLSFYGYNRDVLGITTPEPKSLTTAPTESAYDVCRQLSDISKKGEGTIYLNYTVNPFNNCPVIPDDGEWFIRSYFKNIASASFGILEINGKSIHFEGRFNGIERYSWVTIRRASNLKQYTIISFWRPGRYVVPTFVPPENVLNYKNRCPTAEVKYEDRCTVVTYRLKTTSRDSDLACEFNYKGLWNSYFWFTTDERYECSKTQFTFNNESRVRGSSGYIFTDLYYPRVTLFVAQGCYVDVTLKLSFYGYNRDVLDRITREQKRLSTASNNSGTRREAITQEDHITKKTAVPLIATGCAVIVLVLAAVIFVIIIKRRRNQNLQFHLANAYDNPNFQKSLSIETVTGKKEKSSSKTFGKETSDTKPIMDYQEADMIDTKDFGSEHHA